MKRLIPFLMILMSIWSCNDISPDITLDISDVQVYETEYDVQVQELAQVVNLAIRNSTSFRNLIKEEVLKQFDGDYDLLVTTALDKRVEAPEDMVTKSDCGDVVSVREMLSYYINQEVKTKSAENFLDELIEEYPAMQISVPIHAEDWDSENYTPSIAIIPSDYVEFETVTVPGINSEGEDIEIDAINAPDEPVIVIGLSERVSPLVVNPGLNNPRASLLGQYDSNRIMLQISIYSLPSSATVNSIDLYRTAANSNTYTQIGNMSLLNYRYYDWEIEPDKQYSYYAVVNYTNDGDDKTIQSNVVVISTIETTPDPISNLSVTNEYATKNHLEWNNPSSNNFETQIFRTTPSTTYELIATLPHSETEYYDEPVTPGEKWIYSVKKHNPNTGEVSLHQQKYIYNPYRNPSGISKVVMKEIYIGESAESWLDGRPEVLINIYGQKMDAMTNEIVVAELGVVDYRFEYDTPLVTGLNSVMTDWSFFDDSTYYPVLNINMREYDRWSIQATVTMDVKCGYKYQDIIDLAVNGSIDFTMNNRNRDCGTVYLRYYENPEQRLTFSNHGAYIRISEIDDYNM